MENILNENRKKQQDQRTRFLIWAVAVLLLAAVMRVASLQDIPPGLAQDEVLNADVATFIRHGYHAIFFREGYGHEPLYHYWSVPFQVLLGDNVLSIRLPAVYLGLLLIAATMRWVKREFGMFTALATGLGLAISWWPIIFSRVGIRPIMEPLLLVLFAWFWPRRPWMAGLFLGLSVYTYTGARVMFLLPVLLFIYWFFAKRWVDVPTRNLLRWRLPRPQLSALIVLLTSILVMLPLLLTLREDPSLQQRVEQLEGPLQALFQGNVQPVLSSTLLTLGVFSFTGDPRWTYSLSGRPLFDFVSAVFFYAGLLLALLRFKQPVYAMALFWLIIGLLPSAITPQAPSTVRMIGAIPIVYLMLALGVAWFWQLFRKSGKFHQRSLQKLAAALLAFIVFLNIFLTIRDGYFLWPKAQETREKYQTVWLDIARIIQSSSTGSVVVADSFYRPITADTLQRNLAQGLPVRWIQSGKDVAGAIILPHEGDGRFYVPEYAAPDAQLMAIAGVDPVPLYRSVKKPSVATYQLPSESNLRRFDQEVTFDDRVTLVGYDTSMAKNQQSLQLFLLWRIEDSLAADVTSFVHWLDCNDDLINQHDGFDAAPETLQPGDLVIQRYILPTTRSSSDADGSFHIGIYHREDGRRFLHDSDSSGPRDRLVISQDALFQ